MAFNNVNNESFGHGLINNSLSNLNDSDVHEHENPIPKPKSTIKNKKESFLSSNKPDLLKANNINKSNINENLEYDSYFNSPKHNILSKSTYLNINMNESFGDLRNEIINPNDSFRLAKKNFNSLIISKDPTYSKYDDTLLSPRKTILKPKIDRYNDEDSDNDDNEISSNFIPETNSKYIIDIKKNTFVKVKESNYDELLNECRENIKERAVKIFNMAKFEEPIIRKKQNKELDVSSSSSSSGNSLSSQDENIRLSPRKDIKQIDNNEDAINPNSTIKIFNFNNDEQENPKTHTAPIIKPALKTSSTIINEKKNTKTKFKKANFNFHNESTTTNDKLAENLSQKTTNPLIASLKPQRNSNNSPIISMKSQLSSNNLSKDYHVVEGLYDIQFLFYDFKQNIISEINEKGNRYQMEKNYLDMNKHFNNTDVFTNFKRNIAKKINLDLNLLSKEKSVLIEDEEDIEFVNDKEINFIKHLCY